MNLGESKINASAITVPCTTDGECSGENESFGKYLQKKREAKKMSVRKLASKAKIGYAELSRIENGKKPTPTTLKKLSPYLSEPLDDLLFRAGYNIQTNTDSSIYVDFQGNEINLEEKALRLYSFNVEFFFQLDDWIEHCSQEDIELVSQFIQVLNCKRILKKDSTSTVSTELSFLSICDSLNSLLQASSHLINDVSSN